jgi:hypothetical protein
MGDDSGDGTEKTQGDAVLHEFDATQTYPIS